MLTRSRINNRVRIRLGIKVRVNAQNVTFTNTLSHDVERADYFACIFIGCMSKQDKLLIKILLGNSDANIPFEQLCQLLRKLGFDQRIGGSHHIFTKEGVEEILNLQPKQGKAKAYQVKQIRSLILKYKLGYQDENSL